MASHPQEVLKIFQDFYSTLLGPHHSSPAEPSMSWFRDLPLPSLSLAQLKKLNDPISVTEVLTVISSLKNASSPGPDGFSAPYYKKFSALLSPRLARLFNSILKGGPFPDEMLLVNMSLIPKPNRDHTMPQNYRPISL